MKNIIGDAEAALSRKREEANKNYNEILRRETWGELGKIFPDYFDSFGDHSPYMIRIKNSEYFLVRRTGHSGLFLELHIEMILMGNLGFSIYGNNIEIKDLISLAESMEDLKKQRREGKNRTLKPPH